MAGKTSRARLHLFPNKRAATYDTSCRSTRTSASSFLFSNTTSLRDLLRVDSVARLDVLGGLRQCRLLPVVCLLCCVAQFARAYGELIPTADFAKIAIISSPMLSPDGDKIAFMSSHKGKRYLMTAGLEIDGKRTLLKRVDIGGRFISDYRWASNDRLILDVRSNKTKKGTLFSYNELYSVGSEQDSPESFRLTPSAKKIGRGLHHETLIDLLPSKPNQILVHFGHLKFDGSVKNPIQVVDIYTGEAKNYDFAKTNHGWAVDNEGNIRISVERISYPTYTKMNLYHRMPGKDKWSKIERFRYLSKKSIEPYRFHETDNNILLVTKYRDLGSYDTFTDETIVPLYEYDLRKRKIVGRYENSRQAELKIFLKKHLPEYEHEIISFDSDHKKFAVRSYSDIRPPKYFIADLVNKKIVLLANAYPSLTNKPFASMQKLSYEARDGLEIPAYLTLPLKHQEKYPLVVLPHGGPFSRDIWGFDNLVQFLASRGYAVFQPQFRGSTGFGYSHVEAGYGEWGGKMQEDISDGLSWLVAQGNIDKNKVCTVGASFGGYSAIFAVTTEGEKYRCAIGINGLYDIKSFSEDLSFLGQSYKRKDLLGRPLFNNFRSLWKKSPYELSDNINTPVLLIAERHDTVVSFVESKKLYQKMHANDQAVKYIELAEGEHWRTDAKNETAIYSAIEDFLSEHIGQ